MSFALAWIVFPVVLAALSFGCGLLVESTSGLRLPGPLVVAVGFALLVVAASLATATGLYSVACRAARRRTRGRRSGPRSPTQSAPSRLVGAYGGGRSLRGLCGADRAVRRGDVRRFHHARRHQHVACAHGQGDGERANGVRVGSVDLRARPHGLLRQRLSPRCVHAARCGRCPDRRGHRVALPADDRVLRRSSGVVDLLPHVCARLVATSTGRRSVPRRTTGPPLRLCALERDQRGRGRCDHRSSS